MNHPLLLPSTLLPTYSHTYLGTLPTLGVVLALYTNQPFNCPLSLIFYTPTLNRSLVQLVHHAFKLSTLLSFIDHHIAR